MSATHYYQVPYGKSSIKFNLTPTMQGTVVMSQPAEPLKDAQSAIQKALEFPLGTPRLRQLASQGKKVCIVFTDITRATPDHLLVPALLAELEQSGVRDEDITLLCGIGMHRSSTPEEKTAKLGRAVVNRYRVIDNEPQNPDVLVDLGTTAGGVPVSMHRAAVEADLLIATGIVEPHQYAGYSGGRKTPAIGAAGEALIAHTHGPAFVDHPGTRLGRIEGNPFHEAVTEAARLAHLRFILNVVLDDEKRILRAWSLVILNRHSMNWFHLQGQCMKCRFPISMTSLSGEWDFQRTVISTRPVCAPTYLFFAPVPVVRPGGFFIIPARCEEGAGSGSWRAAFSSRDARRSGHKIDFGKCAAKWLPSRTTTCFCPG